MQTDDPGWRTDYRDHAQAEWRTVCTDGQEASARRMFEALTRHASLTSATGTRDIRLWHGETLVWHLRLTWETRQEDPLRPRIYLKDLRTPSTRDGLDIEPS